MQLHCSLNYSSDQLLSSSQLCGAASPYLFESDLWISNLHRRIFYKFCDKNFLWCFVDGSKSKYVNC